MINHIHFVQSTEALYGGGLGSAAIQLSRELRASGSSSLVVTTCAGAGSVNSEVEAYPRKGPHALYYAPELRARVGSLLSNFVGVVHGHGFYVYPNFVFGSACRTFDVPLVYHAHGMLEPWILARSRWKKRMVHALFENRNFKSARLWRALTGKEADQIRSVGIKEEILVLPNGIDLSAFPLRLSSRSQEVRTAVFLGRLHEKKGLPMAIHAWKELGLFSKGWILKIVGPDENGHRAQLESQIRSLGLLNAITFAGSMTGNDKVLALSDADLFLLPSYSEGLPMAVLESLAASTPVVITDACNLPEVAESDSGWVSAPEQVAFSKALGLATAASDLERFQRGANGRRLVERKFQWSTVSKELNSACEKLL